MDITQIIAEIDAELTRLKQARALLNGTEVKRGPGRPKANDEAPSPKKKKRNLTPEGRARIAAAVKARWAKQRNIPK